MTSIDQLCGLVQAAIGALTVLRVGDHESPTLKAYGKRTILPIEGDVAMLLTNAT